jgi:hypothetical protein
MVEKKCIWKSVSENPQSTSQQDMAKRKDEVKCYDCSGWDESCPNRVTTDGSWDQK